jgi:DNA-binding response OmpR family regulator
MTNASLPTRLQLFSTRADLTQRLCTAARRQWRRLISDVIMTDLNGIDAAIRIRGMLPTCKILLFSGQASTADLLDRARAQGHEFEILAKPVHPQDLLARLRS